MMVDASSKFSRFPQNGVAIRFLLATPRMRQCHGPVLFQRRLVLAAAAWCQMSNQTTGPQAFQTAKGGNPMP